MRRKILNACVLIMMGVLLSSCGGSYLSEYDVGVIYTTEYNDKTKITFLDEKLEEVNSLSYSFSNMSYDGFTNSQVVGDELYLLPKGKTKKLDYGKVISFNLCNGKIKEYDFGRTNITDFYCNLDGICVSSNLNGKNYIDVYDFKTEEIQTIELDNVIVACPVKVEKRIFGIMSGLEFEHYLLCEFNLEKGTYEILYEIEGEPCFIENYQEKLYFCEQDILYEYNIESKELNQTKLPHTDAYNLNLSGDILYIGYTDIFNGTKSHVDIMRLPDKKITKSLEYNGIILQMEISKDNKLYILDYDKLNVYDISAEKGTLLSATESSAKGSYYLGGFYLNEDKTK